MEWRFIVCARNVALASFPMQSTAYQAVQIATGFIKWLSQSDAYSEALFVDKGKHFIVTVTMVKMNQKLCPLW